MVAGNVLHLLAEPERALKELVRVTRPGGVIALPTYVNGEDVDRRFVKMNEGRDFFTKKNMETRYRLQSDPEFNSYPENWRYTFTYDLAVPECTITYTRCAICEMARREGCFRLMRHLCVTDFAQQELMGNTLVRTKTIGNGDELCDFHIIGKRR